MVPTFVDYFTGTNFLSHFLLHQELQEAISKLNSYFGCEKTEGSIALNQDDVGAIGLGMYKLFPKVKKCIAF